MRQIYLLVVLMLCSTGLMAQLPDGSTAPDWTITDLNGGVHNLYDVLDSDKSVIIDFSATWCPPCWSYHQTHILEDMYNEYGPSGTVEPGKIEVYYIESDDATNDACMTNSAGCNGGTQGDWTAGTSYPLANPPTEAIRNAYQITAYPTLLAVCPNRKLYEVGQASKATWESWLLETCALDQDFLATDEVCSGDSNGSIELTVSGGAGTVTYNWSNGSNSQNIYDLSAGTYECTITEGRGHSIETGPIEVGGPATPVQAATETITDISCNGDGNGSISVTGGGGAGNYSYIWSTGSQASEINNLSGGDYGLTISDMDGCTFITSYSVNEPEVLTGGYNAVPATCGSSNGLLSMTTEGGTGPFNFDIGVDNNSSGVFINIPPGIYNGTITDANNCTTAFPILVEDIPAPIAVASGEGEITCATTELVLSGEGSTEGSFINYNWTTNDGEIVDGETSLNPTISAPGTYTLEVLDVQTGCIETSEVTIDANIETPTAVSNNEATIDCANTLATLDGTGSDTGDNISYLWSTENGNITGGETELIAEANAGGVYTLTVTNNDNGCSTSTTVTVNQTAELPVSDAGMGQDLTCVTSEVTLDGSNSSEGANYTYTWTTEDGNIVSGADSPIAVVDASGTYLLEVLNTSNGCSALSSVVVEINQTIPEGAINAPDVLTCENIEQMLSVEVDDPNAYSFEWSTVDGNIVSGGDTDQPLVDAPGEYMVLIINIENGCSSTESILVEEFINTPSADYSFTNEDKVFEFTDNSVGTPTTYMWTFGDGGTSTEQNPVYEYADNGTYEVCLTITNECGENMICNTVTVSAGASLVYDLAVSPAICNGDCNGVYEVTPAEEVENYSISVTGPNGYQSEEFSLNNLCAGEYTFTLMNDIGESVENTFVIEEPTAMTVTDSEVKNVDCFGGENGSINVSLTGGVGLIDITWNNGMEGEEISGLPAGTYTATGTDENGCTVSLDFIVDEPTDLLLTDSDVTNIDDTTPTGSIEIELDGGTPGYSFLWSSGQETQNIDGLGVGEYTVIVTDANGCQKEFGPFTVQQLISVVEIDGLEIFEMLPNPASDQVVISLEFNESVQAEISVLNNLGQVVSMKQTAGQAIQYSEDLTRFAPGLYFVKVTANSQSTVRKLIIE